MLPVQHPGQLAHLVGDTASQLPVGATQAARRFRYGRQIVVAQIGIGAELAPRRLRKGIDGLRLTRLRRRWRVAVDDARIESPLSHDRERAVWRGAPVEAGRIAIMTDCANLAYQQQQAVPLAIDADLVDHLLVT